MMALNGMPKLTETYVSKLGYSTTGTVKFWDSEVRGLVLFVGARTKTWYFQKDVATKTRRKMIGRFPIVSASSARQIGMALAPEWGRGLGRVTHSRVPTLREAVETYVARPKLRSDAHRAGVQRQIELHLGDWLSLPLDQITKRQVADRHSALAKTPSTANHVLKHVRTVWNLARRVHDLPECPTVALEWCPEPPSAEIIEDLRVWRRAIDAIEDPIRTRFYGLLLYTGLRKSEAFEPNWSGVREDHIHFPMTKNGRLFDLPILPVHHAFLKPLRGLDRTWVFPSPNLQADGSPVRHACHGAHTLIAGPLRAWPWRRDFSKKWSDDCSITRR